MVTENIRVVARIRPFSDQNKTNQDSCLQIHSNIIVNNDKNKNKSYTMDSVFDTDATQEEIFNTVGAPIVVGFLEGKNGTIFAYGQTGSGKSYTMHGPLSAFNSFDALNVEAGIIPQTICEIFSALNEKKKNDPQFEFSIKCSFYQIYNEKCYDLLQDNNNPLKIFICSEVYVKDAKEVEVKTFPECMESFIDGLKRRRTAETSMNRESSRSHAFFKISLETTELDGNTTRVRSSCLNLVDLAGSERQSQTNNTGAQLKESGQINNSLLTLSRVISQVLKRKPHISYFDSELTKLLRDSLGGNSKTTVIVNVHQDAKFIDETVKTLDFAKRVKHVMNNVKINDTISNKDIESMKVEIRQKNTELEVQNDKMAKLEKHLEEANKLIQKYQLAELENQDATFLAAENEIKIGDLKEEVENKNIQIEKLQGELQTEIKSKSDEIARLKIDHDTQTKESKRGFESGIVKWKNKFTNLQKSFDEQNGKIEKLRVEHSAEIKSKSDEIAQLKIDHDTQIKKSKQESDIKFADLQKSYDEQNGKLQNENEQLKFIAAEIRLAEIREENVEGLAQEDGASPFDHEFDNRGDEFEEKMKESDQKKSSELSTDSGEGSFSDENIVGESDFGSGDATSNESDEEEIVLPNESGTQISSVSHADDEEIESHESAKNSFETCTPFTPSNDEHVGNNETGLNEGTENNQPSSMEFSPEEYETHSNNTTNRKELVIF
uniref:Kinesin motor domain-containing protein n=1 Tax=Panagrolaimus davidi TaxID=227884 RepID=A0A914PPI7_9BILA